MRIHTVVSVIFAGCLALVCQPARAALPAPGQGPRTAADVVEYECTTDGVTEKQYVEIEVELTMPEGAATGQQLSIGWRGAYAAGGELRAPAAGLPAGVKLYAYAALTGIDNLTSATGVSEPLTAAPGQVVPLPAEVVLKTTSSNAGTAAVRPAAVNIGPRPTEPLIECEVTNAADLTPYTLTVGQGGQASTTPTADTTPTQDTSPSPGTTSPRPTRTVTVTATAGVDEGDEANRRAAGDVATTPVGAAATGGGGGAGPDGRVYVLVGFVVTLAAGAGLLLRRRFEVR